MLVGIALFAMTLFVIDREETLRQSRQLGLLLPLVLLPSAAWHLMRTLGWLISFPRETRPTFWRLFRVRLAADAVSYFTIRGLGDLGPRALQVWQAGLMDLVPDAIDHGVVGAVGGLGRNGWGAALLMRDLSAGLIPPGDDPLTLEQHHHLLDGCAALSAAAWGWEDDVGLTPYELRWCFFGPGMIEAERTLGFPTPVPRIAAEGWHAPLDLVDGAARVYDPIVRGEAGEDLFGHFLKDYEPSPW